MLSFSFQKYIKTPSDRVEKKKGSLLWLYTSLTIVHSGILQHPADMKECFNLRCFINQPFLEDE
jgi:hypothetical protein